MAERHNPDGTFAQGNDGRQPKCTPEQVIEALTRANGIMSVAARHLGVSRRTLIRYLHRWPEVQAARDELRDKLVDLAEGKLLSKINEGNMTAIIFYLKCQAKDRGYVERGSIEVSGSIDVGHDFSKVTDDAIDAAVARVLRGDPEPQGTQ